ncbi:hypothetical protein [Listeria booriae]|uniref:hypothetical protein n=1 Tax=Listeria booriae TaxID=1552123 RepID=UPI001626872B|nr:hypothetical protein [Listeria booriae]MBC1290627.1 hypothetical protein [Listeria booriae]
MLVEVSKIPVRYGTTTYCAGDTLEIKQEHYVSNLFTVIEAEEEIDQKKNQDENRNTDQQEDEGETNDEVNFDNISDEELDVFAEEQGIDLGRATTREGKLKKIFEVTGDGAE